MAKMKGFRKKVDSGTLSEEVVFGVDAVNVDVQVDQNTIQNLQTVIEDLKQAIASGGGGTAAGEIEWNEGIDQS